MKAKQNIADIFPKHLFWDMDHAKLDPQRDKDIIIPRALYVTNAASFEADISLLETLYSTEQIAHELQHTKESISNNVCSWVAARYHIQPFARFAK